MHDRNIDVDEVEQNGAPTIVGALSFNTLPQNDTDYELQGLLEAESHAFFGGSALANYVEAGLS